MQGPPGGGRAGRPDGHGARRCPAGLGGSTGPALPLPRRTPRKGSVTATCVGDLFAGCALEPGEPVRRDDLDPITPGRWPVGQPLLERPLRTALYHVQQPDWAGAGADAGQVENHGDVLVRSPGAPPHVSVDPDHGDAVEPTRTSVRPSARRTPGRGAIRQLTTSSRPSDSRSTVGRPQASGIRCRCWGFETGGSEACLLRRCRRETRSRDGFRHTDDLIGAGALPRGAPG